MLGKNHCFDRGEIYFHDPNELAILTWQTKDYVIVRNSKIIRFSVYPHSISNKKVIEWLRGLISYKDKIVTPGGRTLSSDGKTIRNNTEFIYFIFNADSNAIKIGKAKDVYKRMKSLQTGTPVYLKLLKIIDKKAGKEARDTEQSLHRQFKHLKLLGEWFKFNDELQEFIRQL
ncbi:GIY-YIG nuclease family protein [Pleurocapsa sp. FMAR1]|uniref:GIY-YIG nuclease family protein n=1 Tax=Pleurocapsa sp. FMAR1 TaxID=3040204 RepID=UPI0029C9621A|nr:GIY-YIG nuclease family protein [Pleurocapsa sp. FMAR1]